ncbi:MAG: hypothetical protein WA802_09875 [Terracidiphilus sp.]
MRRILVMGAILLTLLVMIGSSRPAHGFQARTVSPGANENAPSAPLSTSSPSALPEAAGAIPPNGYLLWQDPSEGAFSVSLPMEWRISGGTVRSTKVEAHYLVRAQSPDGDTKLFMDDPGIQMREVPNQGTDVMGVKAGQELPSGLGSTLIVEPYRPGSEFASEYVKETLCPSATMIHGGTIADQTQALNAQLGPLGETGGKTLRADVGEVSFKCGTDVGYVYAITLQVTQSDGPVSIWVVYRIAGYVAGTKSSSAAAAAVNLMLGTFQMNQTWLQKYARESGDTAGVVVRESNAVTQTTIDREKAINADIKASIESSRHSGAAIPNGNSGSTPSASSTNANGQDDNARAPTEKVCDDLGRCQAVDASISNWWSDCSGTFHPGPDSGSAPASQNACWALGH